MTATGKSNRTRLVLIVILGVALALRLTWVLIVDPNPILYGGDQPFYLDLGREIAGRGDTVDLFFQASAPIYPIFISLFYRVLPEENVVQGVRLGQAVLDTFLCLIAFDLARRLFDSRVGLLAAGLLALDLRHVVQAGQIHTEGLTTFLLVISTWAFVIIRLRRDVSPIAYIVVGVLYLLTAFTRAVALPLPVLLFTSLILPKPTQRQLVMIIIVGVLAVVVTGGYAVYNYQRNGSWVLISDGFSGNFWMGSRSDGQWHGLAQFQQEIEELKLRYDGRTAYVEDAFKTIASDPLQYIRLLGQKLASAYLQPHGTVSFPGASLKDLAVEVLSGRMSVTELVQGDAFWPKLYIYIFHYFGLIGGLAGTWLTRHRWLEMLPVTLPILWFTVIYTLLTIIPRYLFPIMPLYMVLAAYTTIAFTEFLRARRTMTAAQGV